MKSNCSFFFFLFFFFFPFLFFFFFPFLFLLNDIVTSTSSIVVRNIDIVFSVLMYSLFFFFSPTTVHHHDGNPILSDFVCSTTSVVTSSGTPTCVLADVRATNVYEYLPCSRRGSCSVADGVCTCSIGFYGKACENIGFSALTTCDSPDLTVHGTCSSLSAQEVLHVKTTKTKFNDFNLLMADSAGVLMTRVGGNGNLTVQEGGVYVDAGGGTILTGGLNVVDTGVTVTAGGLYALTTELGEVSTILTNLPALGVHASVSGTSFQSDALLVKTHRSTNAGYNMLRVGRTTDVTYTWTSVDTSGNTVSLDSVTGLAVNDLILSGLLTDVMGLSGNTMYRIKTVDTSNKKISLVLGTVAVNSVGSTSAISLSTYGSSNTNFVKTTPYDYMTVRGDGHTKITTAGLLITAGGATVTAGGLHEVNTGTTVTAGGLAVKAGGATVTNVGLRVMDGPSHVSNAAASAPSMLVHGSSSSFTGTMATVKTTREANAGFKLQDGVANGVSKTHVNGVGTWSSVGGLVATASGWTVSAGGLHVYAGGTIHTSGLKVKASGVTISAGGLKVVDDGTTIKSTANNADTLTVRTTSSSSTSDVIHLECDRASSLSSLKAIKL